MIEFAIAHKKEIVRNVEVLNKFSFESDQRIIKEKVSINIKKGRRKLVIKSRINK